MSTVADKPRGGVKLADDIESLMRAIHLIG
jgi:hypothetical protein